ncbi:MAG: hypothetical protein ACP5D9_09215 [Mariniphaga sp.]
MKTSKFYFTGILVVALFALSNCTYRLVDFTVISTKNAEIGVDRTKGVPTEGEKSYFFSGFNLKDAMDIALENAGSQYDLLIDGVVTVQNIWFVTTVKVKGTAVSSTDLRASLGEDGFKKWRLANNIFDPKKELQEVGEK